MGSGPNIRPDGVLKSTVLRTFPQPPAHEISSP